MLTGLRSVGKVCAGTLAFLACGAAAVAETGERFSPPSHGALLVPDTTVPVAWSTPCFPNADEAELVLSLNDGMTFEIRVSGPLAACAADFRWRVPGLSSDSARLAVRKGRKGRPESERIVLVSERFTILPTGTPPSSRLMRGAIEWWTDQALFDLSAEDWLAQTMGKVPAYRADPAAEAETDDPDPQPASSENVLRARSTSSARREGPRVSRFVDTRIRALVPLRL
jgi:hypothetical protein